MPKERRDFLRVPDSRLITEITKERPNVASIVNVSSTGLYTVKKSAMAPRGKRVVQLEIPVPEASESIWAVGEVMFDRVGMTCTGSGIRFLSMADCHRKLIQDLVEYRKQDIVSIMQAQMQYHKDLRVAAEKFERAPAPLTEDTVRMYLLPKN